MDHNEAVDKYAVMTMLEALAAQDEQCSRDCFGCKYEDICNKIAEEDMLEKLFANTKKGTMNKKIELELNQNQILQLKDALLMLEREKKLFRDDDFQDLLIQVYEKGSEEDDD